MMQPSKDKIYLFFNRLKSVNQNPKSELEYLNPYTLLVAVTLSAQATDSSVNKATRALFNLADTPQKMIKLGLDGLKDSIKTIGLYNNKAKNIMLMSDILIKNYNSMIPDNREELMNLPGVGRKTANVVLNIAFSQPTIAVDTHVFRVANRTGIASGKTPLEVEQVLLKNIPPEFKLNAHHWLILLGRYICKAKKPMCNSCHVSDICAYKNKTQKNITN